MLPGNRGVEVERMYDGLRRPAQSEPDLVR